MTDSDLTVANEIRDQIGHQTFLMLGAQNLLGSEKGLSFKIRGSRKVSRIRIELAADDTYTVTFLKITGRALNVKTIATEEGVYVDSLHRVIESNTGLRTRLF